MEAPNYPAADHSRSLYLSPEILIGCSLTVKGARP